jgi:hypothetical protein
VLPQARDQRLHLRGVARAEREAVPREVLHRAGAAPDPGVDQEALRVPRLHRDDPEAELAHEVAHQALAQGAELADAVVVLADRDHRRVADEVGERRRVVGAQGPHRRGESDHGRHGPTARPAPANEVTDRPPGSSIVNRTSGVAHAR